MPLDRRQFLNSAFAVPSALSFHFGLSPRMGGLIEFLAGQPQQNSEANPVRELTDLIESANGKLPSETHYDYSKPIDERLIKNTSYGSVTHFRYETRGIPTAYAAAAITIIQFSDGTVTSDAPRRIPAKKYFADNVQLVTPQGRIDIDIYRTPNPRLTLYAHSKEPGRFDQEMYIDSDFDGMPNRGYRGMGLWIHGIPDVAIKELDTMKPDEAQFFRETLAQELAKVVGAVKEYLDLHPSLERTYTIAEGDNLTRVMKRFGISDEREAYLEALRQAKLNGIPNPNKIIPGQTIIIKP